jgi:ketosteroid isomerase-like protein
MSEENVEIVVAMLDAFKRNDIDELVGAFTEDCELYEPPEMPDRVAEGFRGHDGIREWANNLRGIAGVSFEPVDFTASGNTIVSEWVASGRGASSGVPLRWPTFVVLWMRQGRIARAEGYLTRAEALEAAGLSE